MRNRAEQAIAFDAWLAPKLEQDMGRTNQPILVHCVQLDGAAVGQDSRPSDERGVVVMNHVKAAR